MKRSFMAGYEARSLLMKNSNEHINQLMTLFVLVITGLVITHVLGIKLPIVY